MSELSNWDNYLRRIGIEENEKEGLCLVNSLQWTIEDLIKDPATSAKINFEKIRNLRRRQLDRTSLLQRQIRDALAETNEGKAAALYTEAEIEIIKSMTEEVRTSTGVDIDWQRQYFGPESIDNLTELATQPKTECILLTPRHAEPLFPQASPQELRQKLERGVGYGFYSENIIFLRMK